MDKLKTFVVDGDGSRMELVTVGLKPVFLTLLIFVIAIVQLGGLVKCIDSRSVVFADGFDRI